MTRKCGKSGKLAQIQQRGQRGMFQIRKTRPSSTKAPVQLRRRASSQPAPSSSEYPMTRECGQRQAGPDTTARPTRHVSDTKNAPQLNQSPSAATKTGFLSARAILFGVSDDPRMRPNAASWPRYNSAAKRHVSDTKKLVSATPVAASQLRVRSVCRVPPPQGNSAPPAGYLHPSALQPGIPDGWLRLPHPYSHSINGEDHPAPPPQYPAPQLPTGCAEASPSPASPRGRPPHS